jgi:hypothetical protein
MAKKKESKSSKAKVPGKKAAAPRATAPEPEAKTAAVHPIATAPEGVPQAPRERDPRLPPAGTVLQKRDRQGNVRCECSVEEGGIRYNGTIYRSLSAAAMAAAKDLGLTNRTANGFTFWGLSKPPRPPADALAALERAGERYRGSAEVLVKDGVTNENRSKVLAALTKHAEVIEALREKVA